MTVFEPPRQWVERCLSMLPGPSAWLARVLSVVFVLLGVGVAAGLGAFGAAFVEGGLDGCSQVKLQFLGEAPCRETLDALQAALWRDVAFAVIYGGVLGVVGAILPVTRNLDDGLGAFNLFVVAGPPAAAVVDLVENRLLLAWTDADGATARVDDGLPATIVTAVATLKWVLLAGAVIALLLRLGTLTRSTRRDPNPAAPSEPDACREGDLALCCSGGGIRAAAFSLGVLRMLEHHKQLDRVGTVAAVSGGNYAATGWLLERAANGVKPAADVVIERLLADPANPEENRSPFRESEPLKVLRTGAPKQEITTSLRRRVALGRHRFLTNGPNGLSRVTLWATLAVAASAAQVAVVVVAVGWPLGRLIGTEAFYPELETALNSAGTFAVPDRWLEVPALYASLGVVLLLLPMFFGGIRFTRRMQQTAKGLLGLAAFVAFVALVGPWALVQVANLDDQAFYIGGVSLATVLGSLARTFADPLRRVAPRLGGAGLAVLVLLLLGKVASDAATGQGLFESVWVWFGCVVAIISLAFLVDNQTWSLREMYRARLANSFVRKDSRPTRLIDRIFHREGSCGKPWTELCNDELPELIVCCAASRIGLAPDGAPAESFTVSQRYVRHHRPGGSVCMPTTEYVKQLTSWGTKPLCSPAGWMATSGAAFASSMGRRSLGSTNALMAALNIDLGIWLPTIETARKRSTGQPVGLGHLLSEILGRYSDRNETIFVADGGHVENLGLVELLRIECRKIVCVDASGDLPGSFSTLRSALQVADVTLPDHRRLRFDLDALDASPTRATTSMYAIPFWAWEQDPKTEPLGTIHYVKLQESLDQPLDLRQFANSDPRFPNYSTANQLLNDQQFTFLLLAGAHAGEQLANTLEQAPAG